VDGLKEDLAALRAGGGEAVEPVSAEPTAAEPGATEEPIAAEPGATEEPLADGAAAEVDATIATAEEVAARKPDVADAPDESAPAPDREPDPEEPPPTDATVPAAPAAAPEGARVLALKMALDGTPRDETARYLRENFELEDPEALLDEVYARAGG
jgi:hypothetical protein